MLIQCYRIKPGDLQRWYADEEYDCLLSTIKADKLHAKAEKSKEVIAEFLSEKAFISMSWGKDSVLATWLTWQACRENKITMPVIAYSKVDGDRKANPDCDLVKTFFLDKWPSPYIENYFNTYDYPNSSRDLHFELLTKEVGTERRITGIRNSESQRRSTRFKTKGFSTKNTCAPLSLWTTEDVFCYSFMMGLPLHPVYAMNGQGAWDRKDLRVHSIGGIAGCEFSRRSWECAYYPELINQIYPEQCNHG